MKRFTAFCLLLALFPCCAMAYEGSVTDADVLIRVPQLRQYGGFTCGTTCVQMLMNWLFPTDGDINLASYVEALGTTEEAGTSPYSILRYLQERGVPAVERENRTTAELTEALDAGHVIVIPIQAWSTAEDGSYNTQDPSDTETYLIEGHWVICVGYQRTENGTRFFFNDPACVGYCMMEEAELNDRWIDMDGEGRIADHYGIEVSGDTAYDPNGFYHLD